MIEILKVIILAIVEGITEWLPVSSTGHMLLVDAFMPLHMDEAFKNMFFVVIQLGAILAVVVIFWQKMIPLNFGKKITLDMQSINIWLKVIVACIPSAIFGIFLDDWLEEHFGNPFTIALMLIVYGVLFIVIEERNKKRKPRVRSLEAIGYKTALVIGLFQVLSMIPGTSRSGATIIGALLIGVSRTAAAEFTFFLAVPTMFGASLLKLIKFGFNFTGYELFILLLGMVVAFGVSVWAIKFLMGYIKKHNFKIFGWYRILLAAIVFGCIALNII